MDQQTLRAKILVTVEPWLGADSPKLRSYDEQERRNRRNIRTIYSNTSKAIKKARIALAGLSQDFDNYHALIELSSVIQSTQTELDMWAARFPVRKGRKQKLTVTLTEQLYWLLCNNAELTTDEFESFIYKIGGQQGIPMMTWSTVKKRIYRARKRGDK